MKKNKALEAHICIFNDPPQICECFVAGQKAQLIRACSCTTCSKGTLKKDCQCFPMSCDDCLKVRTKEVKTVQPQEKDYKQDWEKTFCEKFCGITVSHECHGAWCRECNIDTQDIKEFISSLLEQEGPMEGGVSAWMAFGRKYSYYNYFAQQILDQCKTEHDKHCGSDVIDWFEMTKKKVLNPPSI
jgi:hypothetical protein